MDGITEYEAERISRQGWYKDNQTFEEGCWVLVDNWKNYVLFGFQKSIYPGEEELYWAEFESISAKDDETAIRAFGEMFRLDEILDWEIQERIVEYRIVDVSDKGK